MHIALDELMNQMNASPSPASSGGIPLDQLLAQSGQSAPATQSTVPRKEIRLDDLLAQSGQPTNIIWDDQPGALSRAETPK
jgi:hypothetical protein